MRVRVSRVCGPPAVEGFFVGFFVLEYLRSRAISRAGKRF